MNARDPGTLQRIFINGLEMQPELYDAIFTEARENTIVNQTRKRFRRRITKTGSLEAPRDICRKYRALVEYIEDHPDLNNTRLADLFSIERKTVARVRIAARKVRRKEHLEIDVE